MKSQTMPKKPEPTPSEDLRPIGDIAAQLLRDIAKKREAKDRT